MPCGKVNGKKESHSEVRSYVSPSRPAAFLDVFLEPNPAHTKKERRKKKKNGKEEMNTPKLDISRQIRHKPIDPESSGEGISQPQPSLKGMNSEKVYDTCSRNVW